jgi:hypothetical protein
MDLFVRKHIPRDTGHVQQDKFPRAVFTALIVTRFSCPPANPTRTPSRAVSVLAYRFQGTDARRYVRFQPLWKFAEIEKT